MLERSCLGIISLGLAACVFSVPTDPNYKPFPEDLGGFSDMGMMDQMPSDLLSGPAENEPCPTLAMLSMNGLVCQPANGQKVERNQMGPPCHTTGDINAPTCKQDLSKGGLWRSKNIVALTNWVGNESEWSNHQNVEGTFQPSGRKVKFPAGIWVLCNLDELKVDAPWAANNPLRALGVVKGVLKDDVVCEEAGGCTWRSAQ